jgi:hypothetical protein
MIALEAFSIGSALVRRFVIRRVNRHNERSKSMKSKAHARRQMFCGFCSAKDSDGHVLGASMVRLARRNAFELIGLRRPQLEPEVYWRPT